MSAEIDEAAARWHVAQADDDMDWTAFTDWLEADPRHREAYDAIALLDAHIDAARPMLVRLLPAEPESTPRRLPRMAVWGAIAAILIVAIAIGLVQSPFGRAPETVAYRAPIGQSRDVRLADGSIATLAPGSVLRVASSRDVAMTLDGNAFFDVRHDPAHPLVVRAGAYEIRDVGTRFEVSSGNGMVRVAVAEGRVAVRSPNVAGEVEIGAGNALVLTGAAGRGNMRPVRAQSVGAWRKGSLVYDDVPLAMVAADIARSTGRPVTVDPVVAGRRFSGVIAPGNRDHMVAALGELTGLKARTDGDAIRLGDSAGR
jgi:transmembrane sensor